MNKSHIKLELLGLCGFFLFGSSAILLLPVTGRCSLRSSTSAKSNTLLSESCCLYNIHHKGFMFSSSLSTSTKSYARLKPIDYDKQVSLMGSSWRLCNPERGESRTFFHFPLKCWKMSDTSTWQDLISTLWLKLWTGKPKHKKGHPRTWVLCD